MARTEQFLRAIQEKDPAVLKAMLDRLSFGEASKTFVAEFMSRLLQGAAKLESWEYENVEFRSPTGTAIRSPHWARVTLRYRVVVPQGETTLRGQPIHWVRRLNGQWYLARAPKVNRR